MKEISLFLEDGTPFEAKPLKMFPFIPREGETLDFKDFGEYTVTKIKWNIPESDLPAYPSVMIKKAEKNNF